ncbi:MAG: hypothetical protein JO300_03315 [Silvibacterium sp.]|nr:hypothetical protein [Silvibacterium sp.]
MKKISVEWWFLTVGVAALAIALILRFLVNPGGENGDSAEGLCVGFSLALFFGGLSRVRRDARRGSLNDSGGDSGGDSGRDSGGA